MQQNKGFSIDRQWLLLLKDICVQAEVVLKRAKLPEDLFHRENVYLSTDEYFRLWNSLEQECPSKILALEIGKFLSPEMFPPVIYAAFSSPDLKTAVDRIAKYKRLLAPVIFTTYEQKNGLFIQFQMEESGVEMPSSLALAELIYCTQVARLGTREPIRPLRVECFCNDQPFDAYEVFFGVKPQQSHRYGLLFSPEDSKKPFLTASRNLWETFESGLQHKLSQLNASVSLNERVKVALLESLPAGDSSIETIASYLALSPRTLQRRLKAENTSFKAIISNTRKELAINYMTKTQLSDPEITFLIGFKETNSFFRAFREWTGKTPKAYRAEH